MTIGDRIRNARTAAALTQKELGLRSGTAPGTIQQYELGKRQPRIEQLKKIAFALDVPIEELLSTERFVDREYENILEVLENAGLSIESTGINYRGNGPDSDEYYVWHTDTPEDEIENDRVIIEFTALSAIVFNTLRDSEEYKKRYIKQRLETELF